jgi:hypothetical protein
VSQLGKNFLKLRFHPVYGEFNKVHES